MAVDTFLKLAGIAGESDDARHKDEIDVLAWSWGVSEAHEGQTGAGASAGKPNFQDLAIKKLVGLASPLLLAATATGSHISGAVLTVRRAGTPQDFLVIRMKNVRVTSVNLEEAKEEDRPSERIMLNFGQIDFDYTLYKPDGSKEKEESFKMGHYGEQGAHSGHPGGRAFFRPERFFRHLSAPTLLNLVACKPCLKRHIVSIPRIAKARRIAGAGSPSGD